ncbi:protein SCO2 homolog, mitochondrial [Antennarius striatus]|uniref:protein SCO2 homolog, mitochondrial n=1 Tax=Antennarius striatus TaxID=241820 RepID=UPI0035B03D85
MRGSPSGLVLTFRLRSSRGVSRTVPGPPPEPSSRSDVTSCPFLSPVGVSPGTGASSCRTRGSRLRSADGTGSTGQPDRGTGAMLASRCIVGDLRGLLGRRPLPVGAQRCFLSRGQRSLGPAPLRTRVAVTLLVGGGLAAGCWAVSREKEGRLRRLRAEQLEAVALGRGNFSLLDHRGRRRTAMDFRGRWLLLYFGFTHCPDICPDELDKLSAVVTALDRDPALPPVTPLFITVDPERDDVAALARYVQDFHPRLVGLTGTPEEVREAGRDYRVYAQAGPPGPDGDYMVDHTVLIYLVDPQGRFLDYYNRTKDQDQVTSSVRGHMLSHAPP